MLAQLNKMVFSAAPHLCLGSAEAERRRQGHWSVADKTQAIHLHHGTALWTSLNWKHCFSC